MLFTRRTLATSPEHQASRFSLRRTGKPAVVLAALASLGALALGGATPASAATRPAAAPYAYEPVSASVSGGGASLQAWIKSNGSDVYPASVDGLSLLCFPGNTGFTWCGATGGGSGNLTLGLNYQNCILIFCTTHGFRLVYNVWGEEVNSYAF